MQDSGWEFGRKKWRNTFDLPTGSQQSCFVQEFSMWSSLPACLAQGWAEDSAGKSHFICFALVKLLKRSICPAFLFVCTPMEYNRNLFGKCGQGEDYRAKHQRTLKLFSIKESTGHWLWCGANKHLHSMLVNMSIKRISGEKQFENIHQNSKYV